MAMKLAVFTVVTALLLFLTVVAMREKRSWAGYRFFAFELNLVLILLNADYWFANPLSPLQIASWIFLFASLYLALAGFYLLKNRGAPEKHFETTTRIVDSGVFRFIRHPMYASLIYLSLGSVLKKPSPAAIGLGLLSVAAAALAARMEERDTAAKFGPAYADYIKKTKMFVPFIY